MTGKLALGLVLALASAAALNWGYYLQHGAAAALPRLSLRRPLRSLALLFGNRRWFAGLVTGIGGWILYVVALLLAPLSLVQAASAGGIALLALLAGRLRRIERIAVAAAVIGLLLLGLSLVGAPPVHSHAAAGSVALWMGVSVIAASVVALLPLRRLAAGAALGIAAGVLYAAGDVGTKAAVGGGWRLAFVPALLACHGLAFVALQLGFQRGSVLATAGMAALWTNALPIAAGTILFNEAIPSGARGVARICAFAALVVSAALLARPPEELRATDPRRSSRLVRSVLGLGAIAAVALVLPGASTARGGTPSPLPGFELLADSPGGGTIWTGRIPNPFVPVDRRLADVYLPPSFTPGERYPVLYLLHGFWGSPFGFVGGFHLGSTADALIASGRARPFIAVMPPGGPFGHNADGEWAGPWEDYVLKTVIPWTDRNLPTLPNRAGRAIAGLSSGGYGAVDMALRHLGTFSVAESWDGYFQPFRDGPFVRATQAVLDAHDPRLLLRRQAGPVRSRHLTFFLSTGGSHGPVARRWTLEFADELSSLHVPHRLWVLPHDNHHFGRAQLPAALLYAEPAA